MIWSDEKREKIEKYWKVEPYDAEIYAGRYKLILAA